MTFPFWRKKKDETPPMETWEDIEERKKNDLDEQQETLLQAHTVDTPPDGTQVGSNGSDELILQPGTPYLQRVTSDNPPSYKSEWCERDATFKPDVYEHKEIHPPGKDPICTISSTSTWTGFCQ